MQFFVPMKKIPTTTSQQKGVNFDQRRIFTKPEVLEIREMFKRGLADYAPDKPLMGPIRVLTKWCYPTANAKKWGTHKSTKPDVGNSVKLFHDVMEELQFFKNDSQIASEINEKFWTEPGKGGVFVQIWRSGEF